jgi:hypothetical protein
VKSIDVLKSMSLPLIPSLQVFEKGKIESFA